MDTRTMELTNIEIKDNFPLTISLYGKSIWKQDENDKVEIDHLLDRQEENYTITVISSTELKPLEDKEKLIDVLKYFFSVCDVSVSPQCMWGTDDCDYNSLMIDFDIDKKNLKNRFENVFDEITKCFPKLLQLENLMEEIPMGKTLADVVCSIEVAYPRTWTVDFITKEKMKRLTTREKHSHGAEGIAEDTLTGKWCRGVYEATAVTERLAKLENAIEEGIIDCSGNPINIYTPALIKEGAGDTEGNPTFDIEFSGCFGGAYGTELTEREINMFKQGVLAERERMQDIW